MTDEANLLLTIAPYEWHSLGTALFCGAIIGLERQLRGKPVGIRTASLIVLGTYLFLATSFQLASPNVDQSRVIGQVITGIGFLGAGVMMSRDGMVHGVTSAACIWMLASLGVVIATGHDVVAMKMAVLVVVILVGVDLLEDHTGRLTRGVHARVKGLRERRKS
ncbi:MAG TPA: MgtC/SapB family protein [Marinobacterium sp.]|nr:MgtC/SapB family protein [Marinobacterium sp.]